MSSAIEAPLNLPAIQPDSTPPAAGASPAGNPVEKPAGNAADKSVIAESTAAAPAVESDDFDENLIPETSRENFRKYREKSQAKLNETLRKQYETESRLRQFQQQEQQPVDLKDIGDMPKLEDPQYKNIEDYTKALGEYYKKVGAAEYRQSVTQGEQQRQQLAESAKLAAKGQQAMQKYTDYRQVVEPLLQVANQLPVLDQYVRESDHGTDVLYQLCKNPVLLESLMKMTPFAQGRELIRLEGLASAPQTKKQTQAPAPMTPVGGGDGNVKTRLEMVKKDDVSDFVAREHRNEIRRRKGN